MTKFYKKILLLPDIEFTKKRNLHSSNFSNLPTMRTIAIVDKYPVVRAGMDVFIRNNFSEISILESDSLDYFEQFNSSKNPDLLIIGNTPESTTRKLEILTLFKRKNELTKIIIYDENPDFTKVSHYFKSGASGYLTKMSDMAELLRCIADVQNGKTYISSEILDVLLEKWSSPGHDTSSQSKKLLTKREYEIAMLLVNGDTISFISQKLQRKVSTISTTKKNIFKKLEITNITDLKNSLSHYF